MSLEQLVDCYNTAIGATSIARGATCERSITQQDIVSSGDAVAGEYAIDDGPYDIRIAIQAQDPLVVPTVAGLSFPAAVESGGRVKGSTTERTIGIANGVLINASMELVDRQAGSCRFELQNKAASSDLATEAPTSTGSARTLVSRATTIRIIAASSTFTPIGGDAETMLGLERVSWQAQAILADEKHVSPGSDFVDLVDVLGWRITGSISMLHMGVESSLSFCEHLAGLDRGALVVRCRLSGQADAASPPADQNITLSYLKFKNPRESLNSKGDATGTLDFNGLMHSGGVLKTLSQVIAAAAA